jgi:hypothetical protein
MTDSSEEPTQRGPADILASLYPMSVSFSDRQAQSVPLRLVSDHMNPQPEMILTTLTLTWIGHSMEMKIEGTDIEGPGRMKVSAVFDDTAEAVLAVESLRTFLLRETRTTPHAVWSIIERAGGRAEGGQSETPMDISLIPETTADWLTAVAAIGAVVFACVVIATAMRR